MAAQVKMDEPKMMEVKVNDVISSLSNWRIVVNKKNNNNLIISAWAPAKNGTSVGRGNVAGKSVAKSANFGEQKFVIKFYHFRDSTLYFVDSNGDAHKAMWAYRYNNPNFPHHSNFNEIETLINDAETRGNVKPLIKKGPKLLYPVK